MNHDNEPGRIIDKLGAAILAAAADGILLADRDGIIRKPVSPAAFMAEYLITFPVAVEEPAKGGM